MNIVIFGATSAIIHEACRLWANQHKADFYLLGRNEKKLEGIKADLMVYGARRILTETFDASCLMSYESLAQKICTEMPHIDILVMAHGSQHIPEKSHFDGQTAQMEIMTNYMSFVSLALAFRHFFCQQKSGQWIILSSVAGDRGRERNYLYGSTKAGISSFFEGLRIDLKKYGVSLLVVKPGLVDTPLSQPYIKSQFLLAKPERVARDIVAATPTSGVLYTPWYWKYIMFFIRNLPQSIFDRIKL